MEGVAVSHARADRAHPGGHAQWEAGGVHRIPGAALDCARSFEGWNSLCARRDPRRSSRPGGLDDVEVRGRKYSFWRGERRSDLRSAQNVDGRVGAHDPSLHGGTVRIYWPEKEVTAPDVNTNQQTMA